MIRRELRAWTYALAAAAIVALARDARALDPRKDLSQYVEQSWGAAAGDGLPQNWVGAIAQTHDGYIWLGTQEGLVRFDGARFTVYSARTTPALRSNNVSTLLVDAEGSLWVGMYGGGLARLRNGAWTAWGQKDGIAGDFVVSLYEDREHALWIGTRSAGVTRRRGDEMTTFSSKDGLPNDTVSAIAEDADGALWVGTDRGISRFDHERFTTFFAPAALAHAPILALHADARGTLWVGTKGEGVWAVPRAPGGPGGALDGAVSEYRLAGKSVAALLADSDGNEWIGTDGAGLFRLHDGDLIASRTTESTRYTVSALFEDREKNVWVGVDNLSVGPSVVGLLRLKDGKVTSFGADEGMPNDYAWSALENADGRLWIGTSHGLSASSDGAHFTSVLPMGGGALDSAVVMAMCPAKGGGIWVGTEGHGLGLLSGDKYEIVAGTSQLPNDTIRALHEDAEGNLWIGTYGAGLTRLRDGVFSPLGPEKGFPSVVVTSFAEAPDHALWVGTERGGLVVVRDGKPSVDTSLASDIVESLSIDGEDLWIGTYGGGLLLLRGALGSDAKPATERLSRFTTREGLGDDVFYAIVDDGHGYLWTTSNRGIFRTSKGELRDLAAGKRSSITSQSFRTADGMKSSECNTGSPGAVRMRDGTLWFPTTKGVARIDPSHLPKNGVVPPVLVEQMDVNRAPVELAQPPELPPESKDFAFTYTALSFAAPERVRFKYRLEGFDRDWVDAGARRVAYYTNLAPGHYRFRVVAANDDGVWNEDGASVTFDLAPRFTQTAPFYFLLAALVLSVGTGAVRLRLRQLRARADELERKVDERTAELASTYQLLREKDDRLHEDLLRAREFQQRILPQLPAHPRVRFAAAYKPADLVGGDLYDVCALAPGRFRVLVADTTGHGVQASLRTMVLKTE